MATSRVSFGEWLPDQPGLTGTVKEALNVSPQAVGYGPMRSPVDYSQAASESINNVVAGRNPATGLTEVFAGGATKLFKLDSSDLSLDNVSKAGGYTTSAEQKWRFTQFGNVLIAANGDEILQYWTLGTSTAWADLDAAAPTARYVTVVRDFVVTGYTSSTDSQKVQWSAINDETQWTTTATNQADFQVIPDGGAVQAITGGEFGLVLMEKSIYRMSYVGTPAIFQFDNISRNLGCFEPNSVVQYQGVTYFLGDDGFYACNGTQVVGIGTEKVDRYFFGDLDEAYSYKISATVDPIKNLIIWAYPSSGSNGEVDSMMIYNFEIQRWTHAETTADFVAQSATPAYTLEALDVFGTLDSLTSSLDSRIWTGGKSQFVGGNGAKIVTFSGVNLTGTINTGDIEIPGSYSMLNMSRPLVDGGGASVAYASRNRLADAVTLSAYSAADSEGRAAFRTTGRYHRLSIQPSGSWTTAIGIDYDIVPAGVR
jgi:hypothetical protein